MLRLEIGKMTNSSPKMNKDASDFMFQEYDKIASAYFGLRDQINEWFKAYITLIGLPLTVLAAVFRITNGSIDVSVTALPDFISWVMILVAFLGLFVILSIVSMRMEMILYARTINDVRRYFVKLDTASEQEQSKEKLSAYLILPISDTKPPFFEKWSAMFWQVLMIGFLDSIISTIAINSLFHLLWYGNFIVAFIIISLHFIVYWFLANRREKGWHTHFQTDLQSSNF